MKSPIRSFFTTFTWRTGLVYGLALFLLSSYSWKVHQEKVQQSQTGQFQLLTLDILTKSALITNGALANISIIADEFPTVENKGVLHDARNIRLQRDYWLKLITKDIQAVMPGHFTTPQSLSFDSPDSCGNISIVTGLRLFADSLLNFTQTGSEASALQDDFFSIEHLEQVKQVLQMGAAEEKGAVLGALRTHVIILAEKATSILWDRMNESMETSTGFYPVLTLKNYCPNVGDTLEGVASLRAFTQYKTLDCRFFANGEEMPVQHSIASFKSLYKTTDNKTVNVEVQIKHPQTGVTKIYKETVLIPICQ